MPVTTGFKIGRRVTTGNATARANSSTVIAIRYGLRPAGTAASSNSATCHTHEAATPRSRIMVLTTRTDPYCVSANSTVAISLFTGNEPAGTRREGRISGSNPAARVAVTSAAAHEACAALMGITHVVSTALPNDAITVAMADTALPHSERSFLSRSG